MNEFKLLAKISNAYRDINGGGFLIKLNSTTLTPAQLRDLQRAELS